MKKYTFAISVFLLAISSATYADEADKLAQQKGCLGCHHLEKKVVGPSFKDVATKYAGKSDAIEKVAKSIQNGSTGAWGQIPMLKNNVTAAEANTLAAWVLAQK